VKWLRRLFGGGQREAVPEDIASFQKEAGDLFVLRIGGVLSKAAIDRFQAIAVQDIARGINNLKVLIILCEFRGWKRGDDWSDIDFFAQYEQEIARIAVVGNARWETETLMFLAAGHRKGEVRYFAPDQEAKAKAWLAG